VQCPRCGRESGERAAFCAGCGAPLTLRDEPPARPLETPVALDRRAPRPARPAPGPADLDTSWWDLGPALAPSASEPGGRIGEPGGRIGEPGGRIGEPGGRIAESAAGGLEPAPGLGRAPETGEFRWGDAGASPPALDVTLDGVLDGGSVHDEVRLRRASGVRRALAWAIDVLPLAAGVAYLGRSLVGSVEAALPAPPTGLDGLIDLAVRESGIVVPLAALLVVALAVYTTLAHALAGATLGKWILGLRVVGPGGARPSFARSATRSLLAVLSAGLVGLGFLLALFTRSGRALHDLLAGTWVVMAP
jgi:uncharacterized RDD family membrane protein YckC